MNKFILIPNPKKDEGFAVSSSVVSRLLSLGGKVFISRNVGFSPEGAVLYDTFPKEAECIIVIGGDGSILDASQLSSEYALPLLGINLGKMGYLSELEPQNQNELEKLFSDEYGIREMMLLSTEVDRGTQKETISRLALNDVSVSHKSGMGMSSFSLGNATSGSITYRADGVLVSTPAGSTAYSLSAGGPIVAPGVHTMLVTPLSPHSFFNRSILFNEDDELCVRNIGEDPMEISVDGRPVAEILSGDLCRIRKSPKILKMITFSENSMFRTLFSKMRLLEDIQ